MVHKKTKARHSIYCEVKSAVFSWPKDRPRLDLRKTDPPKLGFCVFPFPYATPHLQNLAAPLTSPPIHLASLTLPQRALMFKAYIR